MKFFLLTAIFLIAVLPLAAADLPAPPALVPCKTETTCDRNPEHLERFVKDFYIWYIKFLDEDFARLGTRPLQENVAFRKTQNAFLHERMTPHFVYWEKKLGAKKDESYTNHDFCPPGTILLLCTQSWNISTIAETQVKTTSQTPHEVHMDVLFAPPYPYQISVRLKTFDGAWRLDGVNRDKF